MKNSDRRCFTAFSLVEVVVAIGIIAFAIIPLMGLVNVGLKSNKVSADELGAFTIASAIWSDLQATQTTSGSAAATSNRYGLSMPLLQTTAVSDARWFYANGTMISGTTPDALAAARAQTSETIYGVVLNYTPGGKFSTPVSNQPALVSVAINWPALSGTAGKSDGSWQSVATFAQPQAQSTPTP